MRESHLYRFLGVVPIQFVGVIPHDICKVFLVVARFVGGVMAIDSAETLHYILEIIGLPHCVAMCKHVAAALWLMNTKVAARIDVTLSAS